MLVWYYVIIDDNRTCTSQSKDVTIQKKIDMEEDSMQINLGDSDQITRDYFDSLLLETRYVDAELPSTEFQLYGERFATPIMTAALSHLHNICEDGMTEFARGAKGANAIHWIGMGEKEELEKITATGARTVKIIKPHADNDIIFEKIEHAVQVGVFAVGMDIDHSFSGDGKYDEVFGLPMRSKNMNELKEFIKAASVPFIIKGVLSAKDAEKCVLAGAKGIVVSHHHGIMDYSVPPLMILPEIVAAVGHQIPVFIDCGIVSGMDVFKALALGATAVSIGRDLMKPLKNGHLAVCERILQLNGQLKAVMARTGAKSLQEIDPSVIHHRNF